MTTGAGTLGARFISGARGHLFVMLRRPVDRKSGPAALFVPPFGEEMNKTRRMYALTADALVAAGVAALLVDPYGTGDSEGEFRDATWQGWIQDLGTAIQWAGQSGWQVDRILAARLGCALAAVSSAQLPLTVQRTVFWQPVLDGRRFLTQLLRTRAIASEMGDRRETVADLRSTLAAGQPLEVAGYELSSALAAEIDSLESPLPARALGHIHWFDMVREAPGSPRSDAETLQRKFAGARSISLEQMVGEPFWSTVEVVTLPQLVTASVGALVAET